MNWYQILGTVNTVFIFVSVWGVFSQLRTLWKRKHQTGGRRKVTAILSLNQFTTSFMAYLSFFVYGYSIQPFNHFITWPRLIASVIVIGILYEIWRDRKNTSSTVSFGVASLLLVLSVLGLFFGDRYVDQGKVIASSLIVAITLLLAQGYWHQISLIWRSGQTGAVDIRMSQFILMMDISTLAFAAAIGFDNGWPLMLLATVSGVTKIIIIALFRWVDVSEKAAQRRLAWQSAEK